MCHFRAEIIDHPSVEVYLECNLFYCDLEVINNNNKLFK